MENYIYLWVALILYVIFYLIARQFLLYKKSGMKILIIAVSSLLIGFLLSEITKTYSFHLLVLLLMFVSALFYYSWKLWQQIQEKK